jgi:hypothetical protein
MSTDTMKPRSTVLRDDRKTVGGTMMVSEVYWFDCSQRMPETNRMVLVYGSAIGGTRYAGYERSLNEWVLDDMETVSARDVTMWAELPSPPAAHGAPNGFDWMRRFTAYMMSQYEIEEETAQWAAIQCAADEFNLSEVEQRDADWTKSAEAAADEWLWGFCPE